MKDSAHGSKDSTKIETFLKKDEKKPIFQQKDSEDEEDQIFAEFSAQKIKQLELKLSTKIKENNENGEKIRALEEENEQVKRLLLR